MGILGIDSLQTLLAFLYKMSATRLRAARNLPSGISVLADNLHACIETTLPSANNFELVSVHCALDPMPGSNLFALLASCFFPLASALFMPYFRKHFSFPPR